MRRFIAIIGIIFALSFTCNAVMLKADLTVDNTFTFYLSTDDAQAGTYVGQGNNWQVTYAFNVALFPGVTNYIHIYGVDLGSQRSLIGDFTLSDSSAFFGNNTQYMLTNKTDWLVSDTSFGSGYHTPLDYGANGVSPWGVRPNIDSSAHWIWTDATKSKAYFSLPVYVPEPATMLLLGLGLIALRKKIR